MKFEDIFTAGLGAMAMTVEKSKEMIEEWIKKGEMTVQQGKVLNEELKRKAKEKIKDSIHVTVVESEKKSPASGKDVAEQMDEMSPSDIAAIKAKLAEMEKAAGNGTDR